jgi:NitT/TauT family transport system ATP-binding protein
VDKEARKQRAQELLTLVHLERAVKQQPHELSGGMRQRVLLMSSRPGRIIKEWHIDAPEPRRIKDKNVSKLAGTITAERREEIRRHAN